MSKSEFLTALRARLGGLPQGDVAERLDFYSELIDDRMEEGLSEEAAVEPAIAYNWPSISPYDIELP